MQGAIWMGIRIKAEVESMCQSMNFLEEEYMHRIVENRKGISPSLAKWLIEAT